MKVKVCGLRTLEAARAAREAGADFLGFILWPGSRRYVEPAAAARIVRELKGTGAKTVGVVVDAPAREARRLARACGFDYMQLHGHEPSAYAAHLAHDAGVGIIKAFRWGEDFSPEAAENYPARYVLVDTFRRGTPGGTGEAFAWTEAAEALGRLQKPFFLAGGISAENAREAARTLSPFALDVSGSLEENGEKSPERIRAFFRRLRTEGLL